MPTRLSHDAPDFEASFAALLSQKREADEDVDKIVADIIADVRARGVDSVCELTSKFDRFDLSPDRLQITEAEIDAAIAEVTPDQKAALKTAAGRIRAYHERQLPADESWTDTAGATLGWRWGPVDSAGLYVPGGLASYPSSALMNAIPA